MSYDTDIKRHIINIMAPGDHKHREMTEASQCKSCGHKFLKARSEYDRLRKQYPEKFIRKEPDIPLSSRIENMDDMLGERIKNDSLYREHLKKLAYGTLEEKAREHIREMRGFYTRHTGESIRQTI